MESNMTDKRINNRGVLQVIVVAAMSLTLIGAFVGYGVDENILNNVSGNYTLSASNCGQTIIYSNGTAQPIVTLPAVTGFPANCSVLIKNADSVNAKTLTGFPSYVNPLLYPHQSIGVKIVNAAWRAFYLPGRWRPSASVALYVNGDGTQSDPTAACGPTGVSNCVPGVDTNDCLTPTTACLTLQRASNLIINDFDLHGFTATVYPAHGSSVNYDVICTGGPVIGQSVYGVQGDTTAKTAVTIVGPALNPAVQVKDGCTVSFDSVAFADSATNDTAQFVTAGVGGYGHVDLSNITFGAMGIGTAIAASYGGSITVNGANSVTGSENAFASVGDAGVIDIGGTVNGSAGITWGTAAVIIQQGGQFANVTPSTFTGFSGVSGPRCFISNMPSPDGYNPNKLWPGSTDCVVDIQAGALGLQSGSGGSSTLDYGTAGHALLSGGAAGTKDTWDTAGVTCSGSPTSSFAATKGIVTHC
jgi:hypothetical protein